MRGGLRKSDYILTRWAKRVWKRDKKQARKMTIKWKLCARFGSSVALSLSPVIFFGCSLSLYGIGFNLMNFYIQNVGEIEFDSSWNFRWKWADSMVKYRNWFYNYGNFRWMKIFITSFAPTLTTIESRCIELECEWSSILKKFFGQPEIGMQFFADFCH